VSLAALDHAGRMSVRHNALATNRARASVHMNLEDSNMNKFLLQRSKAKKQDCGSGEIHLQVAQRWNSCNDASLTSPTNILRKYSVLCSKTSQPRLQIAAGTLRLTCRSQCHVIHAGNGMPTTCLAEVNCFMKEFRRLTAHIEAAVVGARSKRLLYPYFTPRRKKLQRFRVVLR